MYSAWKYKFVLAICFFVLLSRLLVFCYRRARKIVFPVLEDTIPFKDRELPLPGKELLVIFIDNIPTRSVVASFLEVARLPESLRFMCYTSSKWSDPILGVRPRGKIFENYVLAVTTSLDVVPDFDVVVRETLDGAKTPTLFSHRIPKAMKFEKSRSYLPTNLQRCVVPRVASAYTNGASFIIPDRRILAFKRSLVDILAVWCDSPVCEVLLGEVCTRENIIVEPLPKCVATTASELKRKDSFTPEELRSSLVSATLLTEKDVGLINAYSSNEVLSLVYVA